ncbi:MAG: hypothetical protein KGH63_02675, partial [Candidatus Micrarchaeota archaeon]|nr:hypothetical protein [Candidatus Micrarchaeota archaeon]
GSAGDESWCDRIYSTATRDQCVNAFASANATLCDRLVDSSLRQDCYLAAALRLNDTNYCVRLTNSTRKLSCMKALAPPCSFEPDDLSTQLCQASLHNDYNLCRSNQCFFEFAQARKSMAACDQISGEQALQLACQALVQNDPTVCTSQNVSSVGDYCLQIGAYALNSSSWCDAATLGSTYRNDCYAHFAVLQKDPAYCQKAYPEMSADSCYVNYSITTDSPLQCANVINSLNRDYCWIYTAKLNGDPSACDSMIYSGRPNCYNIVLTGPVPIASATDCAGINDSVWHDKCFLTYAQQTHDITQCAAIYDPDMNATCQSRLS